MKTFTISSLLLLAVPLAHARWIACDNNYISMKCGSPVGGGTFCKAPTHYFSFNNGNYECRTETAVIGPCGDLSPGNDVWHVKGHDFLKVGMNCKNVNGFQGEMKRARLEMVNGNWLWATIEDGNGSGGFGCEVKPCVGSTTCSFKCDVN